MKRYTEDSLLVVYSAYVDFVKSCDPQSDVVTLEDIRRCWRGSDKIACIKMMHQKASLPMPIERAPMIPAGTGFDSYIIGAFNRFVEEHRVCPLGLKDAKRWADILWEVQNNG